MDEPPRPLDAAEFHRRRDGLQAQMARDGISVLLLTSAADIFYVTGFLTRFWESPARPWFVLVPTQGDPVAVIPSIGAALMGQSWITDIRTWDAPCPGDDGVSLLIATLHDLLPERGALGLPMGLETHLRMPLADYHALRDALTQTPIVDATRTVQSVREVKSVVELDLIRATCGIADRSFARIQEYAGEGVPLAQVFRDFQRVLLQEGADWVSYVAGGGGPGGYGDVISPATQKPLSAGDVLMLDTGAVRDGYFCDFDRNFAIGQASEGSRRAHAALVRATHKTARALRPGHRACDVHAMLCAALEADGQVPGGGRLGHGLGITLTEWPSFTPQDQTLLRAGMVLTLEPGVTLPGGAIMVHEENVVLQEDGADFLSSPADEELPVI